MPEIPLRLRRRRDGSLCATDARGAVLTPADPTDSVFPKEHLFLHSWLTADGAQVARVEHTKAGRVIKLTLANATATYEVVEDHAEQVAVMVRQADHKGSMTSLPTERRGAAATALAAQGVLARLVEFKITKPAPIDEARAEQLATARVERERSEAVRAAKALLATKEG